MWSANFEYCSDKRHRAVDDFKNRQISRSADLQRAVFGDAADHEDGCGGRHADDFGECEAEADQLAHDPRQIRHSGAVPENTCTSLERVSGGHPWGDGGFGDGVVEAAATVADVEDDAAFFGGKGCG